MSSHPVRLAAGLVLTALAGACGRSAGDRRPDGSADQVQIDGSSTVLPMSQAAAEDSRTRFPRIRISVAVSGTGGGFERLTRGEIDVAGASHH